MRNKRVTFPVAHAIICAWCEERGFTSDRLFCSDICQGKARQLLFFVTKKNMIDWEYIHSTWRAFGLKRS